jgi:cytochrome P450
MLQALPNFVVVAGLLYYIVSAIYYATLHPLASLPGPVSSAFSRVPYWVVSFRGVDVFWIKRLHDKYGPVVRFGPTDLSYASLNGWHDIHGAKVQEKAIEFFPQPVNGVHSLIDLQAALITVGVAPVLTANHKDHTRMRRIFSPAFSARSLKAQEPLFQRYAVLLKYKVSEVGQKGTQPFNIVDLFNFTTFDVMADLTFGHSLGLLSKTEYSPWVASIIGSLKMLPIVAMINYYPLLRTILFERIQPKVLREQREAHCKFSQELVDERLKAGSKKPDVWNIVLNADGKGKGLTRKEMHSNAEIFMLAGSETTGESSHRVPSGRMND